MLCVWVLSIRFANVIYNWRVGDESGAIVFFLTLKLIKTRKDFIFGGTKAILLFMNPSFPQSSIERSLKFDGPVKDTDEYRISGTMS